MNIVFTALGPPPGVLSGTSMGYRFPFTTTGKEDRGQVEVGTSGSATRHLKPSGTSTRCRSMSRHLTRPAWMLIASSSGTIQPVASS